MDASRVGQIFARVPQLDAARWRRITMVMSYEGKIFMNIRWLSSNWALVASLVAALLTVILLAVLVIRQHTDAGNGQVYLETAGGVGANPFVPPSPDSPKAVGGEVDQGGGVAPNSPGTDNIATCDPGRLATYLEAHPEKASAWAQALNSDPTLTWSGGDHVGIQQISAYIRELTPRVLTDDLRVTNYQFTNDGAAAVQAVLQNGTAVLVDAKGVSRVRCACGNPLTPMIRLSAQPTYLGKPWAGFQPSRITTIEQPPQPKHEPRPQPEPEPPPQARSEREPQPGPIHEPKPRPNHELKHESNLEPKPEYESKPKSESKLEPRSRPKPAPKPRPGPKPEPTHEVKPTHESKPKQEPKPKHESKQEPEPEPET